LQPFLALDTFHSLVVDLPAFHLQQDRNAPITIASILAGQCDDPFGEHLFVIGFLTLVTLGGARLFQCPADPTLRYLEHSLGVLHCLPASSRADQFPRNVSRKIELSSEGSATSFFPKGIGTMSAGHSLSPIPSTGALDPSGSHRMPSASGNRFVL